MIRRDDQRVLLDGPVTLATHVALRDAAAPLLGDSDIDIDIDWSDVAAVDSSALCLILHWRRSATAAGHTITHSKLPGGVTALAELYGLSELIM